MAPRLIGAVQAVNANVMDERACGVAALEGGGESI
jgi:hypothetical protein